jgi:2-aminoethylphosphonate-pyruvate transaminase
VKIVSNPDYATTGSLASLRIGLREVPGDALIIESDLLYEPRALAVLLGSPAESTLLASGPTGSGDEVWVYGSALRLTQLSKQAWSGAPRLGELVGLTRVTRALAQALITAASTLPSAAHYEDGLNVTCARHAVTVLTLDDLVWCEIDDPVHLARARNTIWPKLCAAQALESARL